MKLFPKNEFDDLYHISLPISKSIRARELILDALNGRRVSVENDNDDVFVLSRAINLIQNRSNDDILKIDLHSSGTALRFLIALCATIEGKYLLVGSERLSQRPISGLVNALLSMGAKIRYVNNDERLPIFIEGAELNASVVDIDASVSSQYISALMLISTSLKGSVYFNLQGEMVSADYIQLTQSVIERYKNNCCKSGERDWSSASVWYAVMAVIRHSYICLDELVYESRQPDSAVIDIYRGLGVNTVVTDNGLEIFPAPITTNFFDVNCNNIPDAVLNLVVTACILNIKFRVSGLRTLKFKESDRITSLVFELRKAGYLVESIGNDELYWNGNKCQINGPVIFNTYNDHRVAIAMSLFALIQPIEINNPEVVDKSYPDFWNEYIKFVNIE